MRRGTGSIILLSAAAGFGHVVYPATVGLLARRRPVAPRVEPVGPENAPPLTVIVPAYLEAGVIGDKVADLRANGYPGELTVLVVAEDAETAEAARAAGATVLQPEGRLGKPGALNLGMASATTDLVVATDANNHVTPGSLAMLAAHFADPTIGAVAGEKVEDDVGEAVYWKFESWLKQRESELGTTVGIVGELFAVRRAAWRDIPPDVLVDDVWTAHDLNARGHRIAYEPSARSVEPSAVGAEQWERRTRNSSGIVHACWRERHLMSPRRGLLAFEIVGHRFWRSSIGPVANVLLVVVALVNAPRNALARLVVLGHGLAGVALLAKQRGRSLPAPVAALGQVLYLQLVALAGLRRFFRGDVKPQWSKKRR